MKVYQLKSLIAFETIQSLWHSADCMSFMCTYFDLLLIQLKLILEEEFLFQFCH